MVHGFHIIFGAYGFRLPNDPEAPDRAPRARLCRSAIVTQLRSHKVSHSLNGFIYLSCSKIRVDAHEQTPKFNKHVAAETPRWAFVSFCLPSSRSLYLSKTGSKKLSGIVVAVVVNWPGRVFRADLV
jgi:hypothetical protein